MKRRKNMTRLCHSELRRRNMHLACKGFVLMQQSVQIITLFDFFQKFDRRSVVVLESEKKYWKELSVEFMSDESDDENDSNTFVIHQLSWRSESQFVRPVISCSCTIGQTYMYYAVLLSYLQNQNNFWKSQMSVMTQS